MIYREVRFKWMSEDLRMDFTFFPLNGDQPFIKSCQEMKHENGHIVLIDRGNIIFSVNMAGILHFVNDSVGEYTIFSLTSR